MALTHEQPSALLHAATIPPRLALGSTLTYHGVGKLRSPDQAAGFFEQIGIRPGKPWAIATGATEVLSGLSLAAGLGTRLAALGVLVTQGVAIARVHRQNGFDNTKGGWEFNAALCAIALALLLRGPGRYSVHSVIERGVKRRGRRHLWTYPRARRRAKWLDLFG